MNLAEIRRLYAYNRWANSRVFDAVAALTPEQYAAERASSYPSIRGTLAHIVAAEWIWLQRWQGESPASAPEWAKEPPLDDLRARADAVEGGIGEFLALLSEEDLSRVVTAHRLSGDTVSIALGEVLLHLVNHGTYHRGQLATLLRQAGATPPSTDFSRFVSESSRGS